VFLDGLWLKRSWGGEVKNVSVLVAIGVAQSGYREILAMKPALRTIEPEHSRTSRREKIGKSTSAAM
jgi:transposase-like protein